MPEKEVTIDLHRGLSPCQRGFRVGFGSRMVSFCQILKMFLSLRDIGGRPE